MHRRDFLATLTGAAVTLGAKRIGYTQVPAPAERSWSALKQLLADYVDAKKLAGAAVAVSDGDAPLTYLKAGRIAFDANAVFDEHSVCRIYSMTKPVSGLAAMLLVEAGKLRSINLLAMSFRSCGTCRSPSTRARGSRRDRRRGR